MWHRPYNRGFDIDKYFGRIPLKRTSGLCYALIKAANTAVGFTIRRALRLQHELNYGTTTAVHTAALRPNQAHQDHNVNEAIAYPDHERRAN